MKFVIKEFLYLSALIIFLQNSNAEVQSKIIFNDGKKITGVIVPSINSDSVYINLGGGFTAAYAKSEIIEIKSIRKIVTLGLGYCIPYGMLGVNVEIEPVRQLDFMLGIGTTILAGAAWEVGIIGYILDQDYFIRPRLLLIYGTNSMLQLNSSYSSDEFESYPGLSLGGGMQTRFGETLSFTFDILYNLINGYENRKKELESQGYLLKEELIPINLSAGIQFGF